jgi:pimeloyl-ACP methyl ester carboxylesterase
MGGRSLTPAQRTRRAVLAPDAAIGRLTDIRPPWPGRAVRLDGRLTYVRETPPTVAGAPPALYVHGLGGSSTNWTDLAALLAGYLDGAAIDLPGAGHSDPARRYTIGAAAHRVIRWIEHGDRGPVHLLGNSLGGTIAVKVAASRPDLVRTLTLIAPALPFLDPRRSLQSRMVPLLALPLAEQLARRLLGRLTPEQLARRVIESCFADPAQVPEQRYLEAVEEIKLRYTVDHYVPAYLRTMRGLVGSFLRAYLPGAGSLWRAVAAVQAPTLVIGGRQDRMVDIRVPARTAWAIPDSRLLIIDGAGHVPQLEAPRLVARAVVGLLDELGTPVSDVAD